MPNISLPPLQKEQPFWNWSLSFLPLLFLISYQNTSYLFFFPQKLTYPEIHREMKMSQQRQNSLVKAPQNYRTLSLLHLRTYYKAKITKTVWCRWRVDKQINRIPSSETDLYTFMVNFFSTKLPRLPNGAEQSFQQMRLKQLEFHMQENEAKIPK